MEHQIARAFSPVAISAVAVAIFMAASRLAPFTKPYWTFFPRAIQNALPSVVAGFPAAINAFSTVQTWLDIVQALLIVGVIPLALAVPGMTSPHDEPEPPPPPGTNGGKGDKPKRPTAVPPLTAAGLLLCGLALTGCSGLFAPAAPQLDRAGVIIADAGNALSAAEALLPSLHLGADERASVEALIVRARAALSAAAAANAGAEALTNEQLDTSLVAFRAAWAEIRQAFSAKRATASNVDRAFPAPLALRRAASK